VRVVSVPYFTHGNDRSAEKRGSRAAGIAAKATEGVEEPGVPAPRNLPAYGAWNVEKVMTGTGEALPGPVAAVYPPEIPSL